MNVKDKKKTSISNRGFASMTPEARKAIASRGGKAAHEAGTAHRFTSDEARAAGKKGGTITGQNRRLRDGTSNVTAN